jgi:hypothetical protein
MLRVSSLVLSDSGEKPDSGAGGEPELFARALLADIGFQITFRENFDSPAATIAASRAKAGRCMGNMAIVGAIYPLFCWRGRFGRGIPHRAGRRESRGIDTPGGSRFLGRFWGQVKAVLT